MESKKLLLDFSILYGAQDSKACSNYNYEIFKGSQLVARYWHDFRGDDHGIMFLDGLERGFPFVRPTDFMKGGGPEPLLLTDAAINFLRDKLRKM